MKIVRRYEHKNAAMIIWLQEWQVQKYTKLNQTKLHYNKEIILIISQQDLSLIVTKYSAHSDRSVIWNKQEEIKSNKKR